MSASDLPETFCEKAFLKMFGAYLKPITSRQRTCLAFLQGFGKMKFSCFLSDWYSQMLDNLACLIIVE